jgi:hypothetical protein
MVARLSLSIVFAFVIASTVAAIQQGMRIVIIEGQDAAYVAGQGASTAAIIEVRGADDAPLPNVLVTFSIMPANTKLVSFGNGLMRIGVMTDDKGRATASGVLPVAAGPFSIVAAVVADGAAPSATITQTTYATAADAIRNSRAGAAAPPPAPVSPAPPAQPAPAVAANDLGLQIVVIAGEDGVNIIQQKTAVQPVVEVRDKNGLPVGGVLVTFGISGVGGGASPAAFANGLSRIGVMTDSLGRASAQGLQAIGNGAFNIDVTASMQGQTVSRTIGQSNFQTIADALRAGKTPTVSQGTQGTQNASSQSQASNSGSQSSNAGSQSSNAGSQASNASSAGGSGGGAAGGGAAAGGGGLGAGAITGIAVGTVGAAGFGAYKAGLLDSIFPVCKSEEDAVITASNNINTNAYFTCTGNSRTQAQFDACTRQYIGPFNDALGAWCNCGATKFGDDERQAFSAYVDVVRSYGGNTSSLQRCAQ